MIFVRHGLWHCQYLTAGSSWLQFSRVPTYHSVVTTFCVLVSYYSLAASSPYSPSLSYFFWNFREAVEHTAVKVFWNFFVFKIQLNCRLLLTEHGSKRDQIACLRKTSTNLHSNRLLYSSASFQKLAHVMESEFPSRLWRGYGVLALFDRVTCVFIPGKKNARKNRNDIGTLKE